MWEKVSHTNYDFDALISEEPLRGEHELSWRSKLSWSGMGMLTSLFWDCRSQSINLSSRQRGCKRGELPLPANSLSILAYVQTCSASAEAEAKADRTEKLSCCRFVELFLSVLFSFLLCKKLVCLLSGWKKTSLVSTGGPIQKVLVGHGIQDRYSFSQSL